VLVALLLQVLLLRVVGAAAEAHHGLLLLRVGRGGGGGARVEREAVGALLAAAVVAVHLLLEVGGQLGRGRGRAPRPARRLLGHAAGVGHGPEGEMRRRRDFCASSADGGAGAVLGV
jgi:hypothetical protein